MIDKLERLVRTLNQEKDQYRRQIRDLQSEFHHFFYHLLCISVCVAFRVQHSEEQWLRCFGVKQSAGVNHQHLLAQLSLHSWKQQSSLFPFHQKVFIFCSLGMPQYLWKWRVSLGGRLWPTTAQPTQEPDGKYASASLVHRVARF